MATIPQTATRRPSSYLAKCWGWLPWTQGSIAGEAWVELQDETGKPLTGYTFEDAVSVDRNGVAQEVWWRAGPDVGSLRGRPVRLRVTMRSLKLYAFQFVEAG